MAPRFNALTGQMEDDGAPPVIGAPAVAPVATVDPAARLRAAAPGADPAELLAASAGGPAAGGPDVVQTVSKSPETTEKVKTKDIVAAAKALDEAKVDSAEAAVKKHDAEQELERKAIEADKAREQERQTQEFEEHQRRKRAEEAHATAQASAAKELAAADEKVKAAGDASANWDDRSAPFKILQAFIRGASVKDAYILGQDPSNMPSIKVMEEALTAEKDRKKDLFLKSKEWRETLKSRNAENIKRRYDDEVGRINLEVNAKAKALLSSERTDALAQRSIKNDPNGEFAQATKSGMLARLAEDDAKEKLGFEERYPKTVQTGGTTTTTTDFGGPGGGKPAPQASVDDTEKVTKLEQIAKERRELAQQIAAAGDKDWSDLQEANKLHAKEDAMGKISVLGTDLNLAGPVRAVASGDIVGRIDKALGKTPGGISIEDKLRYNPNSQALQRGLSRVLTQEAKALGGAVTASDLESKKAELGVQGQSAKQMAETLLRQAEDFDKQAAEMRRQRTFK